MRNPEARKLNMFDAKIINSAIRNAEDFIYSLMEKGIYIVLIFVDT